MLGGNVESLLLGDASDASRILRLVRSAAPGTLPPRRVSALLRSVPGSKKLLGPLLQTLASAARGRPIGQPAWGRTSTVAKASSANQEGHDSFLERAAETLPDSQQGSDNSQAPVPETWSRFLQAVLKKDYAIGYLLLAALGSSTLVLSHLMLALTGSPKNSKEAQEQTGSGAGSKDGSPGPDTAVSKLLMSMGMGEEDVRDIMRNTVVPKDKGFLKLLQFAASNTNAMQGYVPKQAPSAVAEDVTQPSMPKWDPQAEPLHAADPGTIGGTGTEADDENVPQYSRVTDDLVAPGPPLTLPSLNDLLGGISGLGGAGSGGSSGGPPGGFNFGPGGWDPREDPRVQAFLTQWLPAAFALSLVLPPEGLRRLVVQLGTSLHRAVTGTSLPMTPKAVPPLLLGGSPRTKLLRSNSKGRLSAKGSPRGMGTSSILTLAEEQRMLYLAQSMVAAGADAANTTSNSSADAAQASAAQEVARGWTESLQYDLPPLSTAAPGASPTASSGSTAAVAQASWASVNAVPPVAGSALDALRTLARYGATPQALAQQLEDMQARLRQAEEAAAALAVKHLVSSAFTNVLLANAPAPAPVKPADDLHEEPKDTQLVRDTGLLLELPASEEEEQQEDEEDLLGLDEEAQVEEDGELVDEEHMGMDEEEGMNLKEANTQLIGAMTELLEEADGREAALAARYLAEVCMSAVVHREEQEELHQALEALQEQALSVADNAAKHAAGLEQELQQQREASLKAMSLLTADNEVLRSTVAAKNSEVDELNGLMGAVLTENEELRRMLAESSHKLPLMEAAARVEADRADHAVAEALYARQQLGEVQETADREVVRRVAEVAVTRAAFNAQIAELEEQLAALTTGFEAYYDSPGGYGQLDSMGVQLGMPVEHCTDRYGLLPDMMEGEAEAEAGLPGPQPLDESPIIQGPPSDVEGIADTGIKKVTKQRQSLRNMSQQLEEITLAMAQLQDELAAGQESLAWAQAVPTKFNLRDFAPLHASQQSQASGMTSPGLKQQGGAGGVYSEAGSRRDSNVSMSFLPPSALPQAMQQQVSTAVTTTQGPITTTATATTITSTNMNGLAALGAGMMAAGVTLRTPRNMPVRGGVAASPLPPRSVCKSPMSVVATPSARLARSLYGGVDVTAASPYLSPSRPMLERVDQLQRRLQQLSRMMADVDKSLDAVSNPASQQDSPNAEAGAKAGADAVGLSCSIADAAADKLEALRKSHEEEMLRRQQELLLLQQQIRIQELEQELAAHMESEALPHMQPLVEVEEADESEEEARMSPTRDLENDQTPLRPARETSESMRNQRVLASVHGFPIEVDEEGSPSASPASPPAPLQSTSPDVGEKQAITAATPLASVVKGTPEKLGLSKSVTGTPGRPPLPPNQSLDLVSSFILNRKSTSKGGLESAMNSSGGASAAGGSMGGSSIGSASQEQPKSAAAVVVVVPSSTPATVVTGASPASPVQCTPQREAEKQREGEEEEGQEPMITPEASELSPDLGASLKAGRGLGDTLGSQATGLGSGGSSPGCSPAQEQEGAPVYTPVVAMVDNPIVSYAEMYENPLAKTARFSSAGGARPAASAFSRGASEAGASVLTTIAPLRATGGPSEGGLSEPRVTLDPSEAPVAAGAESAEAEPARVTEEDDVAAAVEVTREGSQEVGGALARRAAAKAAAAQQQAGGQDMKDVKEREVSAGGKDVDTEAPQHDQSPMLIALKAAGGGSAANSPRKLSVPRAVSGMTREEAKVVEDELAKAQAAAAAAQAVRVNVHATSSLGGGQRITDESNPEHVSGQLLSLAPPRLTASIELPESSSSPEHPHRHEGSPSALLATPGARVVSSMHMHSPLMSGAFGHAMGGAATGAAGPLAGGAAAAGDDYKVGRMGCITVPSFRRSKSNSPKSTTSEAGSVTGSGSGSGAAGQDVMRRTTGEEAAPHENDDAMSQMSGWSVATGATAMTSGTAGTATSRKSLSHRISRKLSKLFTRDGKSKGVPGAEGAGPPLDAEAMRRVLAHFGQAK